MIQNPPSPSRIPWSATSTPTPSLSFPSSQVLDFRKLNANFAMTLAPVDVKVTINDICRSCVAFLEPNVGLKFRVVPEGARAMMDSRRLAQIIINALR